jgi:hypothetical protein
MASGLQLAASVHGGKALRSTRDLALRQATTEPDSRSGAALKQQVRCSAAHTAHVCTVIPLAHRRSIVRRSIRRQRVRTSSWHCRNACQPVPAFIPCPSTLSLHARHHDRGMLLLTRLSVRARTAGHFSKHLIGQLDCAKRLDAARARAGQRDRTRQLDPCLPCPHAYGS